MVKEGKISSRTSSLKSFDQAVGAIGASKNLRRFGQSIKRVAREVKEAETPVGESRATLVEQNERLTQALRILTESYQLALATLVILHNKYMRSKETKNIFIRYSQMREMIKEAVRLETSWWALIDLPKQNRAESFPVSNKIEEYVQRICVLVNGVRIPNSDTTFRENDSEREQRLERVNEMTSKQLYEENEVLTNSTYKLLKKYQAVRTIIKTLAHDYSNSKIYPMIPRYSILKEMIKDVTHHPDYMEHRHESRVQPD